MNYYRCWLIENGQKKKEFTENMLTPFFYEDNADDTLDSAEIILDNMNIEYYNAFEPKTKFRVERFLNSDMNGEPDNTWDVIVEKDNVEYYPGCENITCHRIHCIEASAYTQGLHPDNFALTYELQDVNLNYVTVKSAESSPINKAIILSKENASHAYITESINSIAHNGNTHRWTQAYAYLWDIPSPEKNTGYNNINHLYGEMHVGEPHDIEFKIPKLYCCDYQSGNSWSRRFEMNTKTSVYRYKTKDGVIDTNSKTLVRFKTPSMSAEDEGITELISGAKSFTPFDGVSCILTNSKAYIRHFKSYSITETAWGADGVPYYFTDRCESISNITPTAYADGNFEDTISFTTDFLDTTLTDEEGKPLNEGYYYEVETVAYSSNIIMQYEKCASVSIANVLFVYTVNSNFWDGTITKTPASSLTVTNSFYCLDFSSDTLGGPFLVKGKKYSAYELFRKALLTSDTQIIDIEEKSVGVDTIEYPIIVDPMWLERMKNLIVYETIFEQKNLWEVLIQIGYYLHAVPYLKFADNGKDQYVLSFQQLGGIETNADESTKITIYNSRNLSEYFTAFDAYVSNIFSPNNVVEEWLVPKTSDGSYLISNDTAELHCTYPITEIIEFDITYNGETKSAIHSIFEKSIYEILTSESPEEITPSKGRALYYTLGDSKIRGLNYVAPSVENDNYYSLKYIVKRLFNLTSAQALALTFNDLHFRIKYRTQDSLRYSQIRPDIDQYMKNSAMEKYPHSEQYFGQQDKIIDSERFGANLWGKLERTGNGIYQRQEYAANSREEKQSGELVKIGEDSYYVTKVENEFYNEGTLQRVTYSKNFNQISQVVTIPSEPRFYEVSEKTTVRREVRLMEFLKIDVSSEKQLSAPQYINDGVLYEIISNNIFNAGSVVHPNFAYVRFLGDELREHRGSVGQKIKLEELFPSSEVDRADANAIAPKGSAKYVDVMVPLLHYPSRNSLVYEWDMVDNFKAGDFIDTGIVAKSGVSNTGDDAYYALQPMRYCDVMGRADLFQFKLINKKNITKTESQRLPICDEVPTDADAKFLKANNKAIALDKDCREALSFNLQINLVYNHNDGFVVYPNIWGEKQSKNKLKLLLCDNKKSLFDENVDVVYGQNSKVLLENIDYLIQENGNKVVINFDDLKNKFTKNADGEYEYNGVLLSNVKSIILYDVDEYDNKYAYITRNVDHLNDLEKLNSWDIYPIFNEN